eukprot:2078548-Pleurochrysis_carterae.AAC.1
MTCSFGKPLQRACVHTAIPVSVTPSSRTQGAAPRLSARPTARVLPHPRWTRRWKAAALQKVQTPSLPPADSAPLRHVLGPRPERRLPAPALLTIAQQQGQSARSTPRPTPPAGTGRSTRTPPVRWRLLPPWQPSALASRRAARRPTQPRAASAARGNHSASAAAPQPRAAIPVAEERAPQTD